MRDLPEVWTLTEVTVSWDDGTVSKVSPRQSDIARVELVMGRPFSSALVSYAFMFRLAYAAMIREGMLPIPVPDLDEFMDSVSLTWE